MVLLCFVLDLANLPPALVGELKQCLLYLGNLYALGGDRDSKVTAVEHSGIAVCCLDKDAAEGYCQLRIIHGAKGAFDLREYHRLVNTISSVIDVHADNEPFSVNQGFARQFSLNVHQNKHNCLASIVLHWDNLGRRPPKPAAIRLELAVSILSELVKDRETLASWSSPNVSKKIVIISCLFTETPSSFGQTVLEAADQCLSIEFLHIESQPIEEPARHQSVTEFVLGVSEFDNCTWHSVQWDTRALAGLVKRWLSDILADRKGPLEVVLSFAEVRDERLDPIFCTAHPLIRPLADTMDSCQACRCHGTEVGGGQEQGNGHSCSVTGRKLELCDMLNNCIRVGARTVLHMPSFKNPPPDSSTLHGSLSFTVIKAVPLDTLCAGLLFGVPYGLSSSCEIDVDFSSQEDILERNEHTLVALGQELNSRNLGLICTSDVDMSGRTLTSFPCFYALLPAESGSLLAQRIAASEELLPGPQGLGCNNSAIKIPSGIRNSIACYLSKVNRDTYDPLSHERGCHTKLAGLLKESLQIRESTSQARDAISSTEQDQFYSSARPITLRGGLAKIAVLRPPRLGPNQFKAPAQVSKRLPPLQEPESSPPDDFKLPEASSQVLAGGIDSFIKSQVMGIGEPVSARKRSAIPSAPVRPKYSRTGFSTTGLAVPLGTSPSAEEPEVVASKPETVQSFVL